MFSDAESKAAASADVTLVDDSGSGAVLAHSVERYASVDEASAFMAQLRDQGAKCATFTLTGSAGARTVTLKVATATKLGDDAWSGTATGLLPGEDIRVALHAVRKGAYVSSLIIAPVELDETVPDEIVQLALSKLP